MRVIHQNISYQMPVSLMHDESKDILPVYSKQRLKKTVIIYARGCKPRTSGWYQAAGKEESSLKLYFCISLH